MLGTPCLVRRRSLSLMLSRRKILLLTYKRGMFTSLPPLLEAQAQNFAGLPSCLDISTLSGKTPKSHPTSSMSVGAG